MAYKNYNVALYFSIHDVTKPISLIEKGFGFIEKNIHVSKVYIETYRFGYLVEKDKILKIKSFFDQKGIKTSGGITTNLKPEEGYRNKLFCYSNKDHLDELKKIVIFTAQLFDEIIFDDFYFTDCKCDLCREKKGEKSWSQFRTELLTHVSESILVKYAREANPKVNLIIKYPNWYDDYQGTGYDLEKQPLLFDMIYTGTETRNPSYTHQTLQRYISYFLMRYLENVKPGKNGGGWFDPFDCTYNPGSYAEQAYLTLFAKAKEITLFSFGLFFYKDRFFVPLAGYVFKRLDNFLGRLGNPIGIASYKPYHSEGEDYIHGYLGMAGIPLEPVPSFPFKSNLVLLSESAKRDDYILDHIKNHLIQGKKVVITSGLVRAMQDKGLDDIVEMKYCAEKALVNEFACIKKECSFKNYYYSKKRILIPKLKYHENDCHPIITAFNENSNFPLLIKTKYDRGLLYVLTIPDNYGDLYHYPKEVLSTLRSLLMQEMPLYLEAPGNVGVFVYDNNTFIVESFLPHSQDINIVIKSSTVQLTDLESGEKIKGSSLDGQTVFPVNLLASTFRVFSY